MGLSDNAQQCYVIMPLRAEFESLLATVIRPAVAGAGLVVKGPRTEPIAGDSIFDRIRRDIAASVVCIADLSGNNANVAAEVGLAIAAGKPVVMITRGEFTDIPFDFRHYCILQYQDTEVGRQDLKTQLASVLADLLGPAGSDTELLRQMLAPKTLGKNVASSVIAASPLSYREARRAGGGFPALRKTAADNVGIRGLIRAFGVCFGLNYLPELVNPGDYCDEVVTQPRRGFGLYCLGSPKANRWTGLMLHELNRRWTPNITFAPDPTSDDLRDVRVVVHRDGRLLIPPAYRDVSHLEWDFGILLRAPNPTHPEHLLMILAGRSALGTHAASLAATEPEHIRKLKALLENEKIDLDDHHQAFLAVVHMSSDPKSATHEAAPETLRVSFVEPLQPTA